MVAEPAEVLDNRFARPDAKRAEGPKGGTISALLAFGAIIITASRRHGVILMISMILMVEDGSAHGAFGAISALLAFGPCISASGSTEHLGRLGAPLAERLDNRFVVLRQAQELGSAQSLISNLQGRIMLRRDSTLQHGRYRIIRAIGQGGMGAVYEAYDRNLNNKVAIKEALLDEPELREAFEREAQRLDRLRHIALPIVKDHFVEDNGQYLVMEYIHGDDLSKMLKRRKQPFPVQDVLAWADHLLDALAYLHQEGVIHRDIKPANLKLTPKGQIILLDFGLAKGGVTQRIAEERSLYAYSDGYAPAEQMEGEGTDERSDLYALGATLYALLTAKTPDNPLLRRKYMERGYPDPLLPLDEVNPEVRPHVVRALQQATAIEPANRPASAAQMRAMLQAPQTRKTVSVTSPASTIPPTFTQQPSRWTQPHAASQPIDVPYTPVSSVSTSNNTRLPLFLGVVMAVALLIIVLISTSYFAGNGSNDKPTIVVTTQEPAPTDEAIAVLPTATEAPPTQTEVPTSTTTEVPPTDTPPPTATEVPLTQTPSSTATEVPPTETLPPTATEVPPTQTPAPTATLRPGATAIAPIDGMVLRYVPAGDFEMGSDDGPSDEQPRHPVYLDAFWIDQTEVTNAMFAEFLNQQEQGNQEEGRVTWLHEEDSNVLIEQVNGNFQPKSGFSDHPTIEVSWYGATAYCAWAERRLPTEAEWEKAAGGVLTEEGPRTYPWGNEAPNGDLVNFCDENCTFDHQDSNINDGYERTSPVGNYPAGASPYGAWDMAGNVWEWVSDNYDSSYYASSPRENPTGPSSNDTKVLRGGSWLNPAPDIRVRNRTRNHANHRSGSVGVRCARPATEQ